MAYFLPPKVSDSITVQQLKCTSEATFQLPKRDQAKGRPRASSLGGWVKSMFPSQRPERGGTHRAQGYWEQTAKDQREGQRSRRRITDSHHSLGGESVSSNRIVRWNTARELSEGLSDPVQPRKRGVSAGPGALSSSGDDRRYSWLPRDGSEDQLSVTRLGGILQNRDPKGDKAGDDGAVAESIGCTRKVVADGPPSQAHQFFKARIEARRQRQSLKESGDYLGVQGVNPETGQLDVMTPTDSSARSSISQEAQRRLTALRNLLSSNRQSYGKPTAPRDEVKNIPTTKGEEEKFLRLQKEKQRIKDLSKSVKWRRHGKQWSSAQEPDLSPITQSVRSTSPGSRSQSNGKGPKAMDARREGKLVDDSPPKARTKAPVVDTTPQEVVGDTPDSSGTIIRTPRRRSVADPLPAAWELFANGISFDDSDSSHAAGRGAKAMSSAAIRDDQRSVGRAQSLHQVSSASGPVGIGRATTPGKTAIKSNGLANTNDEDSFLGTRAGRRFDPGDTGGGPVTLPASAASHLSQPFPLKDKRRLGLMYMRSVSAPNIEMPLHLNGNTAHGSITPEEKCDIPKTISPRTAAGNAETQTLLERQPLRKIIPHLTYLRRTREKDRKEGHQSGRAVQSLDSASVTNSREASAETARSPTAVDLLQEQSVMVVQPKGSEQKLPTKDMMEKDMLMLRHLVARVDKLESKALHQTPNQCKPDHEWIDDAIRDITIRANEVKESCACTPITTTIGCDHHIYSSNPKPVALGRSEERQHPPVPYQLNRVNYNRPVTSWSVSSLEKFSVNPSSNTVQSAITTEEGVPVTDTTCMGRVAYTKQQTEQPQNLWMAEKRSMSCRSTSTEHRVRTPGNPGDQSHSKKRGAGAVELQRGDADCWTPKVVRLLAGPTVRPKKQLRIPGSYPAHLDASDDTGSLLEIEPDGWHCLLEKWERFFKEEEEGEEEEESLLSELVIHRAMALFQLYWETVWPLLSGHERPETLWMVCVMTVLAAPIAILGSAALVQLMKLVAVTWVFVRSW